MKYLKVKRQQRDITISLTPEALIHTQEAILSWVICLWAQYSANGFSVNIDLSHYGLKNDFDIENAFAQHCESMRPVARTLHASLLQWGKSPTSDVDNTLESFAEFNQHLPALNQLKPVGKAPKYSVKKQKQGPGVIMTLREDVISVLGIESARLCVSALSNAIAREKAGPVGLYNPFTAFTSSPATDYVSMSMWLMKTAFVRYLTDMPWTVAQIKEMLPHALALQSFFDQHAIKA